MRLVFMGTPHFAVPSLKAALAAGHDIMLVISRPPRPTGRRGNMLSPVAQAAAAAKLHLVMPENPSEVIPALYDCRPDAAIIVAYGSLLRQDWLCLPRWGCINLHASLLPRWRGAAPIQRAIAAGDSQTGITAMHMDMGLDTGPILRTSSPIPIKETTYFGDLHDQLAELAACMLPDLLHDLETIIPQPQPETGVCWAPAIQKSETQLNWQRPAKELARLVRALYPRPRAWFEHKSTRIAVLAAEACAYQDSGQDSGRLPGTVLDDAGRVSCGQGSLRLMTVARAGRNPQSVEDFLRGYPLQTGDYLPCP